MVVQEIFKIYGYQFQVEHSQNIQSSGNLAFYGGCYVCVLKYAKKNKLKQSLRTLSQYFKYFKFKQLWGLGPYQSCLYIYKKCILGQQVNTREKVYYHYKFQGIFVPPRLVLNSREHFPRTNARSERDFHSLTKFNVNFDFFQKPFFDFFYTFS